MNKPRYRLLIIDDTPEDRELYRSLLCEREECEYDICEADSVARGIEMALAEQYDCLLVDYVMPDGSGLDLIERYFRASAHRTPIVMVTGRGDERVAVRALKLGASDYILKSELTSDAIYRAVHNAIDKDLLKRALADAGVQLRDAKDRAERASAAKSSFLANMSHEIRTPLSAILGFSELISRGNLNPDQLRRFSLAILKNGETLMQILNDVLDLSKIEAGKLSIEAVPVDVHRILTDVLTMFEATATRKNLRVTSSLPSTVPEIVALDPTRLRQILFNLLSNAIKFTEHGEIGLVASYADAELTLEVHDTGIGIAPDQIDRLFRAFEQGDETTTRRFGGTGLGLLLARRLAEAMGGQVALARTRVGEGSVFQVRLPAPRLDSVLTDEPTCGPVHLGPLKILVVEDSVDARTLIKHVLTEAGAEVDEAEDGAMGLSMACGKVYDVIVSDLRMPNLDGHDLARRLRAIDYRGYLLGLSAHAFAEDRETALKSGFDDFLPKPVTADALCRRILERMRSARIAEVEA